MAGSLLLVGGDSEIGGSTARHLRDLGIPVVATTRRHECIAADRPFLDLALPLAEWRPPPDTRAACILAAVPRLQACEEDPAGSAFINVTQTIALGEKLLGSGISVLFLSTDKVFDGKRPHMRSDAPLCPVSEYGRQKARVEAALRTHMNVGAPVAILRLAKVVSPGMPLLRQWIAAFAAGEPVRAFSDMRMAPVPAAIVGAAIAGLLDQAVPGVFQLTGPRDVSYAEVAVHLARTSGADARRLVMPVSARSAGMLEGSTANHTTLDSAAIRERLGIIVPDPWAVIDDLAKACRD
jgi:dTDP-4-dehydrorhamnose reductase